MMTVEEPRQRLGDEALCPVPRAVRRTPRTKVGDSLTVKTTVPRGTSVAPLVARPLDTTARQAIPACHISRDVDNVDPDPSSSAAALTRLATCSARARRPSPVTFIYHR